VLVLVAYLGFAGAAMGSFVDALTWRLHNGRSLLSGRSECESCHTTLGFVELIPLVGWALLRGRCRHCGAGIGVQAPLAEAALATLFVLSYAAWSPRWGGIRGGLSFGLWLACLVLLAALAVYDLRWMRLPDAIVVPLLPLGLAQAVLRAGTRPTPPALLAHALLGAAALGGLYALVHVVSRGQWIGLGDVKLALVAGVLLGGPRPALLALLLANVFAAAVAVAGLLAGRIRRDRRMPMGPFLVGGVVVAALYGNLIALPGWA
jgi:leader peptidase (prepilin peptidase) / N-methyltransferase